MINVEERIAYLIHKKLRNDLTYEEQLELELWENQDEENKIFLKQFTEAFIAGELQIYNETDTKKGISNFRQALGIENPITPHRYRHTTRLAIAVFLLIAIITTTVYITRSPDRKQVLTVTTNTKLDIYPPEGKKVQLKLSDGRVMELDTANGLITTEGTSELKVKGSSLIYEQKVKDESDIYNTVSTPVGGTYKLVLSDKTVVWLNSSSSIRFPVSFNGRDRKVELTGEAYFEVSPNKEKSFIVSTKGDEVQVLGTSFNVNAYSDDPSINTKTTLFSGSVLVKKSGKQVLLKPGQEARSSQDKLTVIKADLDKTRGWRDGLIVFRDAPIEEIMKMAAHYYDIRVQYAGKIKYTFSGIIEKKLPVSVFLDLLSRTTYLHYEIREENTIIIKP